MVHGMAQKTDLRAVQLYEKKELKFPQVASIGFAARVLAAAQRWRDAPLKPGPGRLLGYATCIRAGGPTVERRRIRRF